jgi:peptide chain release factor 2
VPNPILEEYEYELEQLLSGPYDKNGAYLIINIPEEDAAYWINRSEEDAAYWAEMLLRMYAGWGENRGYRFLSIEDYQRGCRGGINSAILAIDGRCAYGYLKSETGVHLLKHTSPFNITKKQASSATVEVLPMDVQLEIPQQDLEIIWHPPGPNGWGVPPWVEIVHVPTGISAISNQRKKKEKALAVLTSKLFAIMQRQGVQELADIQGEILKTALNQPIREYQFASDSANQGKVLDLRTGIQTTAVAEVLDGKLDLFIKAGVLLKH